MFQKNKRKTVKTSKEKARDRAWRACSQYIRTKECIETTGEPEWGVCCSCGRTIEFKKLDAGHFLQGRKDNILFLEEIIHIQCRNCNRMLSGNYLEYEKYMINRYGKDKVEKLKLSKYFKNSPMNEIDFNYIEKEFKEKLKILKGKL